MIGVQGGTAHVRTRFAGGWASRTSPCGARSNGSVALLLLRTAKHHFNTFDSKVSALRKPALPSSAWTPKRRNGSGISRIPDDDGGVNRTRSTPTTSRKTHRAGRRPRGSTMYNAIKAWGAWERQPTPRSSPSMAWTPGCTAKPPRLTAPSDRCFSSPMAGAARLIDRGDGSARCRTKRIDRV